VAKLTRPEIYKVVNDFIGVSGGYLGDFSYRSHAEFYPYYCDLDIDIQQYRPATTREAFLQILEDASGEDQAKILRGILAKYPPDSSEGREKLAPEIRTMIARLDGAPAVSSPRPKITTDTVERAIGDAETLIQKSGATSGVDRIHTALHGYLIAACDAAKIPYPKDPDLTQLIKLLRQHHPKLQNVGPRAQDITQVLRAMGAILDALNPVRNRASVAHPNASLLAQEEAMLVVNAARTILHYLDSKLSG
jgi:abortive infection Abi-like protein